MIYLASTSPRRAELLTLAGIEFQVEPAEIDEVIEQSDPTCLVESLALKKARAVAINHPTDIIIAADTVVYVDQHILGKPKNKMEAMQMLANLSNRTHLVYTGYCILKEGKCEIGSEVTTVEFYNLSANDIEAYVSTGESLDKAGAYGIQGQGALLVRKIEGDFYNVVGLPIAKIMRILCDF